MPARPCAARRTIDVSPSKTMWSTSLAVAEPVAEARLRQEVRRVRHRLHAAGDDDARAPPARIIRSAISIARIDDAHTLLIVSAGTSFGIPAPTAACRAGAWPTPGLEHLAHDHVLDLAWLEARRARAPARIAIAPSSVAGCDASPPPSRPNGVRTADDDDRAAHSRSVATDDRSGVRRGSDPACPVLDGGTLGPMRVLVVDNYDSFTYNLVHLLEELGAGSWCGRATHRRSDQGAPFEADATRGVAWPRTPE